MIEGIYNSPKSSPETGGVSSLSGVAEGLDTKNAQPAQKSSDSDSYSLSLSDEAWEILGSDKVKNEKGEEEGKKERDLSGKEELSDEDKRKVKELEKIDRNVHVHEEAHLNAAGGYARGGANYSYVTGPDGKRYANAGSVNLDTSPEKEPEATIRKADFIRRAALAPADPSPSDRQIAADAVKMEQKAQTELAKQRQEQPEKLEQAEKPHESEISKNSAYSVSASADGDVSVMHDGSTAA
jgi:hypothetical protein